MAAEPTQMDFKQEDQVDDQVIASGDGAQGFENNQSSNNEQSWNNTQSNDANRNNYSNGDADDLPPIGIKEDG